MLGRYIKAGKYLLKILLCHRIARELMLSVSINTLGNKVFKLTHEKVTIFIPVNDLLASNSINVL